MKILFMGTPDIAAESLAALLEAGHEICGVFTREDKPVGRHHQLTAPPVKQLAVAHGIPVYQPKTLRNSEARETIQALAPQLIVVVAYGRILPPEVISIPPYGCINLHVSLLPRYRGAAPVQWAVLNGDEETGVSIMYIAEGVDTGDILSTAPVSIGENETAGQLFARVSTIGAAQLVQTVADIAAGRAQRIPQDHSLATQAPPLHKEMGLFTFAQPRDALHNLVRGLHPWPVAYFQHEGKKIKVLATLKREQSGQPGQVLSTKPLVVACPGGSLELCQVVPEGSRPMEGAAWAAGRRLKVGDSLLEAPKNKL